LVNSTPKYFYLLPLHFALVKRYAAKLHWPSYIATEVPEDQTIQDISKNFGVNVLRLEQKDRFFIESRLAACKALPRTIRYVLPMQEDFLLGGRVDEHAIQESLKILDLDAQVASIRWMPCPGPKQGSTQYKDLPYKILNEEFMFTYQATLWRREEYIQFLSALLEIPEHLFVSRLPIQDKDENQRKKIIQVDFNLAENHFGQQKFQEVMRRYTHLAWPRAHQYPNAVMVSPWPYRPTAVEKGKVGEWVYEFAKREGFPIGT
jgi:hypothetical protein